MKTIADARVRYVFEDYHPREKVVSFEHRDNPNAIIFNATRPLFGQTWQGDFIGGVFYAAIDPTEGDDFDQKISAGFIDRNVCLDAAVLKWFTRDDVMGYAEKLAEEYNASVDEWDFSDLVRMYYDHIRGEL